MSLVELAQPIYWPWRVSNSGAPAIAAHATLDAAGEYWALVSMAEEDMVISHVGFRVSAVVASGAGEIRIESVDTSNGRPSGNLWATDTNIATGALTSGTWALFALTAPATIARGEIFAVKIAYESGTSFQVCDLDNLDAYYSLPYEVTNLNGVITKGSLLDTAPGAPAIALGSSSTSFYNMVGILPILTQVNSTYGSASATPRRGIRFKLPMKIKLRGLRRYTSSNVADFSINLYTDAGSLIATKSYLAAKQLISATGTSSHIWDEDIELAADTWYRAALIPTTVSQVNERTYTVPSADYLSASWGGVNYYRTFWTAATQLWTDDQLNFPMLDLMISHLDDGAGGDWLNQYRRRRRVK